MRTTKIVRPAKLSLVSRDSFDASRKRLTARNFTYYGAQYAKDYDLTVVKPSSPISESGELYFQMEDERPPGSVHETKGFASGKNLYPSYFTKPFQYRYSDVDPRNEYSATGGLNWIGQNNYNVKSYIPFGMSGPESATLAFPFMFEHNGDLYLLAESRKIIGTVGRNTVCLFKRIGEEFAEVYDFRDVPVDTNDYTDGGGVVSTPITSLQIGSACGVSVNGNIYIAYRYYDRAEKCSWIIVYKSQGASFQEKTRVRIRGSVTEAEYADYRLRMAYGDGVFMIVSYGLQSYEAGQQEVQSDFRTLISYDFCDSFHGRTSIASGTIDSVELEKRVEFTESLFSVNVNPVDQDPDNLSTLYRGNTKFSLHYDKQISCFVLFKGANPDISLTVLTAIQSIAYNAFTRADHLIGLIAPVSKPFDWQVAARYRLNRQNIAIGDYINEGVNFDIDAYRDTEEGIYISDICAISNGLEHFLLITSHGQLKDWGNSLTKISFIDSRYMPRASLSSSIAFGQKVHKDYVFMLDPITTHASGFAHGGTNVILKQTDQLLKSAVRWQDPIGCFWKNQMAFSMRLTETALAVGITDGGFAELYGSIFNRYTCLAISGEHSNLTEEFGYEFSYPKRMQNPFGFNFTLFGAGTNYYDNPTEMYVFTDGPVGMSIDTSSDYPSIADRIRLNKIPKFKTRFQARFSEVPANCSILFFEYRISSFIPASSTTSDKYTILLGLYYLSDGSVKIGRTGAEQTVAVFEQDVTYDIMLMTETGLKSNDVKTYFAYKEATESKWTLVEFFQSALTTSALSYNFINYGMLDTTGVGVDASLVSIGDVHISSYGAGYKPQLQEYEFETFSPEPLYQATSTRYTRCRAATSYSKDLIIFDGIVRMHSFKDKGYRANRFALSNIRQRNSINNILSDSSDLVYNLQESEVSEERIILQIADLGAIDTLAMINCAGIDSVEFSSGVYDELTGLWSVKTTSQYDWPRNELQRLSVEDRTLLVEDELASHELFASYLHVEDSGSIIAQIKVVDNIDSFIFVEADSSIISPSRVIYSASKSATFSVGSVPATHTHIEILINKIPNADVFIGRVSVGKTIDLSDCITEASQKVYSFDKILTSNTGFSFSSNEAVTSVADILDISIPKMTVDEPYFNKVLSLVNSYTKNKEPITVIQESEDYKKIYHGNLFDLLLTPNGREYDLQFSINSINNVAAPQNYDARDWTIDFASSAMPIALESVNFNAYIDDITGLTISYQWDFGDGNSATGESVSNTYLESGEYIVTLTATDQFGRQDSISRTVFVTEIRISDYELSSTGGPTAFTITITAKDKLGATVDDDSTILYIEAPSLVVSKLRLSNGAVSFSHTSTVGSTIRVSFIDSLGRSWTKRITL